MRRALNLSAKQTAALCILGGLIAAGGFLVGIPVHTTSLHHPHSTSSLLWVASVFTTVVLGITLSLFANSSLENGIVAARWSDQEIESLRTLLNSRPSNILNITLVALVVAFVVMAIPSPHLYPIFWACFILSQSFSWMRNTVRRQASSTNRQPTWSNLAPLRSDHWGQH
jgi:hypothetical protein